ncbi:MAG: hypothetical protein Kow0065_07840 [Methylomicrobium sp.]
MIVVLPASGWEIIAKVRLRFSSETNSDMGVEELDKSGKLYRLSYKIIGRDMIKIDADQNNS